MRASRMPGLARAAVVAACAAAFWGPLADGAGDVVAYVLAVGSVAAGALASGLRPRGPAPLHSHVRVVLLVVGIVFTGLFLRDSRGLFPAEEPLSSAPMAALFWIVAVSSFFLYLPDGPLAVLMAAGATMLIGAYVDYGTLGLTGPFAFLLFCVLHGLAAGQPERGAGGEPGEHYGPLVELAAVLSGAVALATGLVYLSMPLVLPDVDLSEYTKRLRMERVARAIPRDPAGTRATHSDQARGIVAPLVKRELADPGRDRHDAGGGPRQPDNRSEAWLGRVRSRARQAAGQSADHVAKRGAWLWPLAVLAVAAALAGRKRLERLASMLRRWFRSEDAEIFTARQERDFLEKLAAHGLVKEPWETLHEFLARLSVEGRAPAALAPLVEVSVRVRYSGRPAGKIERDVGRRLLELLDTDLAKLHRAS
ncbi:MAG: DUF4129 domain-containing protein [Candidatus Wallbacteria bacterium]|nr:DUF4129 domain-containing protein [Candidatus Wallbacteria bacterium]